MKTLICIILLSTSLEAQHEKTANIFSNVTVGTAIGLDAISSLRNDDSKQAFLKQGERLAITVGAAELTKFLIHRTRPNGRDRKSFYSEHTSIAAASMGWNYKIGFSLALATGTGRVVAKEHWVSDTVVGAVVGSLVGMIR